MNTELPSHLSKADRDRLIAEGKPCVWANDAGDDDGPFRHAADRTWSADEVTVQWSPDEAGVGELYVKVVEAADPEVRAAVFLDDTTARALLAGLAADMGLALVPAETARKVQDAAVLLGEALTVIEGEA